MFLFSLHFFSVLWAGAELVVLSLPFRRRRRRFAPIAAFVHFTFDILLALGWALTKQVYSQSHHKTRLAVLPNVLLVLFSASIECIVKFSIFCLFVRLLLLLLHSAFVNAKSHTRRAQMDQSTSIANRTKNDGKNSFLPHARERNPNEQSTMANLSGHL